MQVSNLHAVSFRPKQLAGIGSPVLEIDLLKITLDDLKVLRCAKMCQDLSSVAVLKFSIWVASSQEVEKPLTCSMRRDTTSWTWTDAAFQFFGSPCAPPKRDLHRVAPQERQCVSEECMTVRMMQ